MAVDYLAPSGIDTLDGLTEFTPWKTVAKVVSSSAASDVVRPQRGGQWREFANPLPTAQTWLAHGVGERPEITALDLLNLTWASDTPTNSWTATYAPALGIVTAVRINGVICPNAASKAALVPGQFFYTGTSLTICLLGGSTSMAGITIEANGARAQALTPGNGKGGYLFKGIWLSGGTNVTCLMQTQASPSTWVDCKLSDGGITTGVGLLYFAAVGVAGHVVDSCLLTNGICDLLYGADSPSCIIRNSDFINFYGSLSDHIQMSGSSGGSGGWLLDGNYHYVQPASGSSKGCVVLSSTTSVGGTTMQRCFCVGGNYAFSWGNSADTGNDHFRVDRNITTAQVSGSTVGAFGCGCACTDARWTFNVVAGVQFHGINLFNSKTRTASAGYHNTILSPTRALSSAGATDLLDGDWRNNILQGGAGNPSLTIRGVTGGQTLILDYNWYDAERANFLAFAGVSYSTIAAFQAATGFETHGRAFDPMLRNPAYAETSKRAAEPVATLMGRWYHWLAPDASSQAIGAAAPIPGVNDSQGATPTVGAVPWLGESRR